MPVRGSWDRNARPRWGPASEDRVPERSKRGAPCAPDRVPEARWGPSRFRGPRLGGAGHQDDPLQERAPGSPPAAWPQWSRRRFPGPNQY